MITMSRSTRHFSVFADVKTTRLCSCQNCCGSYNVSFGPTVSRFALKCHSANQLSASLFGCCYSKYPKCTLKYSNSHRMLLN